MTKKDKQKKSSGDAARKQQVRHRRKWDFNSYHHVALKVQRNAHKNTVKWIKIIHKKTFRTRTCNHMILNTIFEKQFKIVIPMQNMQLLITPNSKFLLFKSHYQLNIPLYNPPCNFSKYLAEVIQFWDWSPKGLLYSK